jgi:hypothetical protein
MKYETILNLIWWPMARFEDDLSDFFMEKYEPIFFYDVQDKFGGALIDMENYEECFKIN